MKGTVLFTKKNVLGIYGFIKCSENETYYFDTSCVIKGNFIQKGSIVSFDVQHLPNGKTKAINVMLSAHLKLQDEQRKEIEELLTTQLDEKIAIDCAVLPFILKNIGIDYKEYNEELSSFIQSEFGDYYVIKKNVQVVDKVYQTALVKIEPRDILPLEKENEIADRLAQMISEKGYILCSILPVVFSECDVDYKQYSINISQFVEKYLTKHFQLKKHVPMNGKILPSILTLPDANELQETNTIMVSSVNKEIIDRLEKMLFEEKYFEVLNSEEFVQRSPNQLGSDGVLLLVRAVAGFLGDDTQIILNDFQQMLIEAEHAADLTPLKDNENVLMQGMQSSFIPMTTDAFKMIFSDVYHGKNNLNNNWNALTERFWGVKNDLAFYMNALWMISLKKERCVDFYIEESIKSKKIGRIADILNIWKSFSTTTNYSISLRLKRKIMGNCLDCGDTDSLCKAIELFDDFSMPEAKLLPAYLSGESRINNEIVMSFFHSNIEALVSEKLTNYFWYRMSDGKSISDEMIKVLSSICWDYDAGYMEVILYNNTYEEFGTTQKAKILLNAFQYLCQFTETYKKAYVLVSYIYAHIVDNFSYVSDFPRDKYYELWRTLNKWMTDQVKSQFSEDIKTSRQIAIFKYDDVTMREMEATYCESYIKPQIEQCIDEEDLDDIIDKYEKEGVEFITQWIDNNYRNISSRGVDILIDKQRFSEAIRWIQTQNSFGVEKKKALLRRIICENFKVNGFGEHAYDIYVQGIPIDFAETILLENFYANEDDVIKALFATYIFKKDWLKVAYMYAPYSVTRNNIHPKLYENIKYILNNNGIEAVKFAASHFDVIKTALRVLSNEEFDDFIAWAKKIQIPYGSKNYKLKPKTFDNILKNLLSETEYSVCWNQLLILALRTDNTEQQDMLRYSIIVAYIGRYGDEQFERIVANILKGKVPSKDYYGYYSGIWKGLFTGRYGCNVLSLNRRIIDEAPITYWNIFYDVAVCKNHIFTLRHLWGTQWHDMVYDMQGFYSDLVARYSESREPIFLQIAVKLLEDYDGTLVTDFDKYLPYCNSNKPKEFLFQTMIFLLKQKRYLYDIGLFLKSDYWFFTEVERKLSSVLELICEADYTKFNEQKGLEFDEYWFERFVSDFLNVFAEYPQLDVVSVMQKTDGTAQYRFSLVKYVFQISYSKSQLDALIKAGLVSAPIITDGNNDAIRSYLEMMDICYKSQLQTNTSPNLVWLQNRYHRILAIGLLLKSNSEQFSDEDIVALMQSNKHFSDVYNNYKGFRDALINFAESNSLSEYLRSMVLLCVVSNEWEEFIDHIEEYELIDLASINSMMVYSNYRELNMQLLERYLLTKQGVYSVHEAELIKACSPKVGYVLDELHSIRQQNTDKYELIISLLIGICRLKQQNEPKVSYEKLDYSLYKNNEVLHGNWNMFIAALWSTSYETSIIFMFGDDIRKVNKRCSIQKIELWEPIFHSISQMSVYYYLLAVWYAIDQKREEAKAAYEKIIAIKDIPAQWSLERKELETYLNEQTNRFFATSNKRFSALNTETEAKDLDFITTFVGSTVVSSDEAVSAYKTIASNANKDIKLVAYKKLFSFVRNPDNLYEVFRQLDIKKDKVAKQTYNELVISFGSLLIIENDESISHDEKYIILSRIFEVFELLSDLNKEKASVIDQLKAAESFVLGTPGLSMSIWMNNFERIKEIIRHPAIGNPTSLIDALTISVEQCIHNIAACETQMQILDWLTEWRSNWNISSNCSDYEHAFAKSVDEELYRLRHGAILKLVVLNDIIEDESIFFQVENMNAKSNAAIVLNNMSEPNSAQLKVLIGINGSTPEVYDNPGFDSIIELRPGDVCGQAYRLHNSVLSRIQPGNRIEVILNIVIGGVVVCNNAKNRMFLYGGENGILAPDMVTESTKYETAVPAFTKMIKGFGREREKKLIREFLEQQLVVIYGPSRVGKSSLMNYINNDYTIDYCSQLEHSETSVVSIMIAGEDNPDDYRTNMLDQSQSISHYDTKQMLEYLFIAPLLAAFDSPEQDSRCEYFGREFPREVHEKIRDILTHSGTIGSKYKAISRILEKNNCEIWLLYDEFQQTITRLDGEESELARLCNSIKYNFTGIKLVLCGSDDLLRLFECENDPKWNDFKIKTSENSVSVGQLEYSDFVEMIEDQRVWYRLSGTKPFSEAALKLLHRYTGGNAICGKIFGNQILNNLHNGLYQNRRKIYPSDITRIAYLLLLSEVGLVKNLLVAHNTKNLDNEMKYLLFIANELAEDVNRSDVSYRKIREFFVSRRTTEIDLALKILVARGILKTGIEKKRYGFTTMFYFDFFKSQVTEARMQELYDIEHPVHDIEPLQDDVRTMQHEFSQLDDKRTALFSLYGALSSDEQVEFRKGIGELHTGDNVSGDKINKQNILINAHTINTAFTTLLNPGITDTGFLAAFQSLPTLSAYFEEKQRAAIKTQSTDLLADYSSYEECFDEDGHCTNLALSKQIGERIVQKEEELEQISAPAEQKMISDTMGAVVGSDIFMSVSDKQWGELLHIKSEKIKQLRELPSEFATPLSFAVVLHNVFDNVHKGIMEKQEKYKLDSVDVSVEKLDYCPVAIMYCKIVEAMLKHGHTPLYIRGLGNKTLKLGGRAVFSDLGTPEVFDEGHKELSIGSFVSHLVFLPKNKFSLDAPMKKPSAKDFRFGIMDFKNATEDYNDNIRRLIGDEYMEDEKTEPWKSHARALKIIQEIRNRSAHEAVSITKENFDWLIETLFEKGELMRIWDLSQK